MANVVTITRSTLIPMSRAVSWSTEVARMAVPSRVFCTKRWSPTISSSAEARIPTWITVTRAPPTVQTCEGSSG